MAARGRCGVRADRTLRAPTRVRRDGRAGRRKVAAAVRHGLVPVVCVGETLEERRAGRVDEAVILRQLGAGSAGPRHGWRALPDRVRAGLGDRHRRDGHARRRVGRPCELRAVSRTTLGVAGAQRVPLLYGGSVKPDNAAELLAAPDVDGVLVGGASLDPVLRPHRIGQGERSGG